MDNIFNTQGIQCDGGQSCLITHNVNSVKKAFCLPATLSRAFTLVETLVVLAIIAILAALIIPAVDSAFAHAASTQSISNLKQFSLAYTSFSDDNGGRLPPASCAVSNPSDFGEKAYKKSWDFWLLPYLGYNIDGDLTDSNRPKAENVFMHKRDKNTASSVGSRRTYGVNMLGITPVVSRYTSTEWARLSQVRQPSRLILLTECPYASGVIGKYSYAAISPCVQISNTEGKRDLNPGGVYNYLFVDGHVESLKLEETYRSKDAGYRISYNGGPVPGVGTGNEDLWRNIDPGGGANGASGETAPFSCRFCTNPWN
jgi:prepilin-type N-terminal cleavage/methylation domain-containing protein/prepilin-type processing-associated H-X9-DG protein